MKFGWFVLGKSKTTQETRKLKGRKVCKKRKSKRSGQGVGATKQNVDEKKTGSRKEDVDSDWRLERMTFGVDDDPLCTQHHRILYDDIKYFKTLL